MDNAELSVVRLSVCSKNILVKDKTIITLKSPVFCNYQKLDSQLNTLHQLTKRTR